MKFVLSLVCISALFMTQARHAAAYGNGIAGYSGAPGGRTCTSCHGGGVTPSVSISGPTSVNVGSANTYSLTVSGGARIDGGLDVSATAGSLASLSSDTKVLNAEIVHSAPKAVDAQGNAVFQFKLTAPAAAGSVVLYGSGLSSSRQGTSNSMSKVASLNIMVNAIASPTPAPTVAPTATPTPRPTATPVPTASPTPRPTATPLPTAAPTAAPTASPTPRPTATPVPTLAPTATPMPTASPIPTAIPTPIVANIPPSAVAGGPYAGYAGSDIVFDASASRDSDGSIVQYLWDFGDGQSSSGMRVIHQFLNPGVYNVSLSVVDNAGASARAFASASVADASALLQLRLAMRVSSSVSVPAGQSASASIQFKAAAPSATSPCATARLLKNGKAVDSAQVCLGAKGKNASNYMASFSEPLSSADAGVVIWSAYLELEGQVSKAISKSTSVIAQ